MKINENIRRLRIAKGMTQEELGKFAHVGKTAIHKYETGEISNVPYDRIIRIANALGVTPGALMGWEDEPTEPTVTDDPSVAELLEYFANRPDGKVLFSVAKDCTPEEIIQAVKIIEALKK